MSFQGPFVRNLKVRLNAADELTISVTDLNGTPIDLSAYGFRAMIRGAYSDLDPLATLSVVVGDPTNMAVISWTAEQATTIANAVGRGVWDLYLDPNGAPDATSWLALKGDVIVEPVATR